MADSKISGLPAVATPADTDEFAVNQAGTSKKITLSQILGEVPDSSGSVTLLRETAGDGFDVANARYESTSLDVSSETLQPRGIVISADGTKFFVISDQTDAIFAYDLSTPYDASTAVYSGETFDVSSEGTSPHGVDFKPDGTMMYVADTGDNVFEYSLSTAWDVSTATYTGNSLNVFLQDSVVTGIKVKPDGTAFYLSGDSNDTIFQYSMSTPWDLSTASYASKSLSVAAQETNPQDLAFNADGSELYVVGTVADAIFVYTLSTPWDISTGSYSGSSVDISSEITVAGGLCFEANGLRMYVSQASGTHVIHQYATYTPFSSITALNYFVENSTALATTPVADGGIGSFAVGDGAESHDIHVGVVGGLNNAVRGAELGDATATGQGEFSSIVGGEANVIEAHHAGQARGAVLPRTLLPLQEIRAGMYKPVMQRCLPAETTGCQVTQDILLWLEDQVTILTE